VRRPPVGRQGQAAAIEDAELGPQAVAGQDEGARAEQELDGADLASFKGGRQGERERTERERWMRLDGELGGALCPRRLSLSLSLSLSFHIPTHRHLLGVHRRLQVLQELGEVAAAGAREVLAALKKGEREG